MGAVSDLTGPITADGTAMPLTLATPGQNALLPFSGTAGQKVSVTLTNSTFPSNCGCLTVRLAILKPDGTELGGYSALNNSNAFVDTLTLPSTGTYTVSVNPTWLYTAQATVTLYTVSDVTTGITPNGPAVPVTLATPGQIAQLTFSGTANQQVSVQVTGNTMGTVTVTLLKPDGTQLTVTSTNASSFTLPTQVLPTTGTHTVVVDPAGTNTGSLTVTVVACGAATVSATPVSIVRGNAETATWSGICAPTTTDWVGLYVPGAADTPSIVWRYTTGAASGSVPLTIPTTVAPGTYELRLFSNDSHSRLAVSNTFTVSQ